MPRRRYHLNRSSIQYRCASSSVPGFTKYSISICSNSRVRKMKLPGVISLRKDFPRCAIPNGSFLRDTAITWVKSTKMPWAVSGRSQTRAASPLGEVDDRVECRAAHCAHCGDLTWRSWTWSVGGERLGHHEIMMTWNILSIVALIGANAFFVAAEFSLVAIRRTRVKELVS